MDYHIGTRRKVKMKHIFIIYLIVLADVAVLKYYGNMKNVIDRVKETIAEKNNGSLNLNLIPFRSISMAVRHSGVEVLIASLMANIFVFVPMGFLIPYLLHKPSFLKTIGISLAIIVGIELIQFITCLGILDIDDIILNAVGSVIGYAIYLAVKHLRG
jgi:glycopeptide antibiotics resistance protein